MNFTRSARAIGTMALAGALLVSTAPAASADSTRDNQWALKAFEAEKVWQESEGEGVTVAVIDDGVDGSHPDLRDNVLPGRSMHKSGGPANAASEGDHGTAMASLIAGHGHGPGNQDGVKGLAPKAKILPVMGSEPDGRHRGLARAIDYAIEQGASVINLSLGDTIPDEDDEEAIALAWENDILVVAASGNRGRQKVSYPAGSPGVVAVGAINEAGNVWEDSNYGDEIMLTAPGVDIEAAAATTPYDGGDGTSNATAYVSAAAALIRAKYPDLTAGQVANRLVKTALLPEAMGEAPDPHYGYGMIRPYRALTEDIPAGSKAGPLTAPEGAGEPGSKDTGGMADQQKDAADRIRGGSGESESDNKGIFIVGGVAALTVIIVLVVVLQRVRRRRNQPPPGWGGPGHPGQPQYQGAPPPGHYPQGPPGHYPQGPPPGGPPRY